MTFSQPRPEEPANADGDPAPRLRDPSKPFLRFLSVWFVTVVCGAAVAAGGALLAARIMEGTTTGIGDIVAVVVSLLVGFPLGACAGIAVLRRALRWPGSLVRGVVGAVLGAMFVVLAAEPLRLNADTDFLLLTYTLCVTVFATFGYMARR